VAPSWSHQLTSGATRKVAANYREASYQGSGSGLSDYQNLGGWLLGSYDLSEVTRGLHGCPSTVTRRGDFGAVGQHRPVGRLSHRFSETLSGR